MRGLLDSCGMTKMGFNDCVFCGERGLGFFGKMEDGRWKMEDGRRKMEDGR